MMYPRLLLFLGAIAGLGGLASAGPGSPALADETSSNSPVQATSADSFAAMAVETATNASDIFPVTMGLRPLLVQITSAASAAPETSTGAPSSVQTGLSVSTQPTSEEPSSSSSNSFTTPERSTTHITASTSQTVTSATISNPSSVFDSSTTSNPSSVFDSSTTSNPSSVFDSLTTSNPSSVFDSSTASNPSSVFDSSTTSNPSSIFNSSTTSNPSNVFDSSTPSSVFDSSTPSSVFDSSTQSNPSTAPGSRPPTAPYSSSQPAPSVSTSPILIIVVVLFLAFITSIVIVCFIRRRKRRHSQTFEPLRKRKGKAEDAWAGPVALPEDSGVTEGTEEKKDAELASKRLSLSTFFNKRKSRAVSMLLEEVDEVGNAKSSAQEAQQPLLANGQVIDPQTPEQTQIPVTDQHSGEPAPQVPSDQGLLLPPPPPPQPNGHVQGPESEQGPRDDLLPPPSPPLGNAAVPPPETHEGEELNSFSVKTSL